MSRIPNASPSGWFTLFGVLIHTTVLMLHAKSVFAYGQDLLLKATASFRLKMYVSQWKNVVIDRRKSLKDEDFLFFIVRSGKYAIFVK